jgi:small subunit ribosomal protein S16
VAVRIRLKRMGKVRTPFYRIVVCDSRTKRDGRVIEEIGTYNPKTEPSTIHVDSERALHWLGVGAQPSTPVAAILRLTGDWQRFKGEPGESTLRSAEPRRDKTEVFNEALKEAHGDRKSEPVTKKAAKPDRSGRPEKRSEAPTERVAGVERADKAHAETASGAAAESESGAASGSETSASDQAASDQAASDQAASDQAASDQAASGQAEQAGKAEQAGQAKSDEA